MSKQVVVIGSGNAALCAALAAQQQGARVLVLEKADAALAGGNSKYTAGAMRFVYDNTNELLPLLQNPADPRLENTDFGCYSAEQFAHDLLDFNDGCPLSAEQHRLIAESRRTVGWLAEQGIKFEPIYSRQSFEKDGKSIFWGGLTLAAVGEGPGLVDIELEIFLKRGGKIAYDHEVVDLIYAANHVQGVVAHTAAGNKKIHADAVVLGCGGFEANAAMCQQLIGDHWDKARVRGTPHNTGQGLQMAWKLGAVRHGYYQGCHATPVDLHMKEYGNLALPHLSRKHYRKICYFLGIMVNAKGERFVDEGKDFRNYTYAQFGKSILEQPHHLAWQIFDAKVTPLLYEEYRFEDAHFVTADTLGQLVDQLEGVASKQQALNTIETFNHAVDSSTQFDPTIKDGKRADLPLPKSNWAQSIDTPPFMAYPVTCGITFTYGGLKVNNSGQVLQPEDHPIEGLYACGELVGGVFFHGYPGGSGLTSGAVFGKRAGEGAAN